MDVTRGATPVANAGADALGSSAFYVAQTLTYTITNSGTATLNLTGAPGLVVATAGTSNCTAGVSTQPASATVAPAASVTFVVTFTVMAAGVFNFTVSAANNDSNENPMHFRLFLAPARLACPKWTLHACRNRSR